MKEGDLVKLNCFRNGKDEAIGVADEIEKKLKKKYSLNNISILVRAIFQTREFEERFLKICLLYTSPSPRDTERSRMPSSA